MPIITVEMFAGRDVEQKKDIVKSLTNSFCQATGANASAVHVIIKDIAKSDWGIGGELCSDKFPD